MGGKKKKYNARFPPARIKKIMQTDEEVGKIAAAVPVVISRALELFLESIITESVNTANESNARTLSSSHIKSVIQNKPAFDFLKSQVSLVPDLTADGAETLSAAALERRNSSKPAVAATTALLLPATPVSTTDNAQPSHPVLAKKRSNPAPCTSISEAPRDPAKPKRKRGRPPKIRQPENAGEIKQEIKTAAQPLTSIAPSLVPLQLPPEQKVELPAATTNGEKKEVKIEPGMSVPSVLVTSTSATNVVAPIAVIASTAIHSAAALCATPPSIVLPKPEVPNCIPGAFKLVAPSPSHKSVTETKPIASLPLAMPIARVPAPTCTVAPIVPVPIRPATEHLTDAESDGSAVESIFDTNTTVGLPASARTGLQPPAHTSNNISRYYTSNHPLNLTFPKGPLAGPPMYSPTSQPIDLSNKVDPSRSFPQSTSSNPHPLTEYINHATPTTVGDKEDV